MAKVVKRKLASKPKLKARPKTITKPKIVVEEPTVQAPPLLFEAETAPVDKPEENPLQFSNNINMETKEESIPEMVLPVKEEIVEQKEGATDSISSANIPIVENINKPTFLEEKPVNEEITTCADKPKKSFLTFIVIFFAFLLGVLLGGFVVYKKNNVLLGKKTEPIETVSEKQEQLSPSPIPKEEPVDLAKYSIEILNGSGAKGVAGELKDLLSEEGFTVSSTGNATSSSFTKSVIRAKKEVNKQYLKKLEDFLLKSYALSEIQELEDSKKTDIEIIIGTE